MATQNYRDRSDETVGENSGTSRPVHPARPELNVPAGGENKTPAPVRSAGELEVLRAGAWGGAETVAPGGDNPGRNRYAGPVSLPPGVKADKAAISAMAPKDAVLEGVIAGKHGVASLDVIDDWQTRRVDDRELPPTHGATHRTAADGSPGGQIPKSQLLGPSDAQMRRAAGLKQTEGK